jgi:hypothetical protein
VNGNGDSGPLHDAAQPEVVMCHRGASHRMIVRQMATGALPRNELAFALPFYH